MIENRPKILNLINKLNKNKVDKDVYNNLSAKVDDNTSAIDEIANNEIRTELVKQTTEQTINQYIEDGTIANLTIKDNSIETIKYKDKSITEEKLSDSVIERLDSAGYVYDKEGNKYTISIDENGDIILNRIYETIKKDLVLNIEVIDDKAVETITNTVLPYTIKDGLIVSDKNSLSPTLPIQMTDGSGYTVEYGIKVTDYSGNVPYFQAFKINGAEIRISARVWKASQAFMRLSTYAAGTSISSVNYYIDDLSKITYENYYINKDTNIHPYSFRFNATGNRVAIYDLMGDYDYPSSSQISLEKEMSLVGINGGSSIAYIRVYNRWLNDDEVLNNLYSFLKPSLNIRLGEVADGLTSLGSAFAFYRDENNAIKILTTSKEEGNHSISLENVKIDYNIQNFEYPSVEYENTIFEGIKFLHKPDYLYIDETFNLLAMPFPFDSNSLSENFFIKYSIDKPNLCDCVDGILIPKQAGTVIITATMENTLFQDSFELEIKEKQINYNIYEVSSNYTNGLNALLGGSPEQTMRAIKAVIRDASEAGYNYIKFPKTNYYIIPIDLDENNICCYIPNQTIIDFNDSSIYIQESLYCRSNNGQPVRGYNLFRFEGIENSSIINATIYGERYENTENPETYYSNHVTFASFLNCQRCDLKNIIFNSVCGMNVLYNTNAYSYWFGSGRRGCFYPDDFTFGKLDDEGNFSENSEYVCTPNLIKFEIPYEEIPYFKLGLMGNQWYVIGARWIDVYWYNESQELISVMKNCYQFEPYKMPENAVYCKLCYKSNTLPNKKTGERQTCLDLFPFQEPYLCYCKNITTINPHAGSITYVGGYAGVIEECVLVPSAYSAMSWAIDYEDGWMNMRYNIVKNSIITGLCVQVIGQGNCYINSYFNDIWTKSDALATKVINNYFKSGRLSSKEGCNVFYNTYRSFTKDDESMGKYHENQNNQISSTWPY